MDRAKAALDGFESRFGIHRPIIGLNNDNGDPEVREVISRRYIAGIEATSALGARQMVIHQPFNPCPNTTSRLAMAAMRVSP